MKKKKKKIDSKQIDIHSRACDHTKRADERETDRLFSTFFGI